MHGNYLLIMISCDTIIENNALYLRNLDKSATSKDVWTTTTAGKYDVYYCNYEKNIVKGHIYYYRCNYKYTTTNQSPTWVQIYSQGGYHGSTAKIDNPVAGQEYVLSGYATTQTNANTSQAVVYNGPSGVINGVVASVKNFLVYDITALWTILKSTQAIQNNMNALVAWCDENLEYVNNGVNYDITDLVENLTKITMYEGNMCCEPIECDGMQMYSSNTEFRNLTYFDSGFHPLAQIYNNAGNGKVVLSRVLAKDQNSPFLPEHQYVLKIETKGTASPGAGGFFSPVAGGANKTVVQKIVAKIPVGYTLTPISNTSTSYVTYEWLTDTKGTGEWEEYTLVRKYKPNGSYSTDGHIYLVPDSGYSATAVTWYIAYMNTCDVTGNEELKNYTALPNKDVFKGNKVFSREFNTANFIPNGTFTDSEMTLPNGWTYDNDDYAGNAKRSIVQPVGANAMLSGIFGKIKITPNTKYRLSFWVKCKGDMSSFLTTIRPYTKDDVLLTHEKVIFVPGTETTLSADLVSGATQMTVANNKNWVVKNYSYVGFRAWNDSYNTKGTFTNSSTGVVAGTSGTTIVTFKTPYTGATMPKGTYVVESYAGNNYPYPIMKENLPKDNTWKYVEGYFGEDMYFRGASEYGWTGLPGATHYIEILLNYNNNNGTVPIKFSDIRLEQVGKFGDGERYENKIQFKKHN